MKIIKGDLVLEENTEFNEDLRVEGNIEGCFDLKVAGDINAWNINARDIDAGNINAWDINAREIICERRIKRGKNCKTFCRIFIENKSKLQRREWNKGLEINLERGKNENN